MKLATTTLFTFVVALLALGMVMLSSASTGQPEARYLIMQPIWCGIGLIACWLLAAGDYRWLKKFSGLLLLVAVALLGLVIIPGVSKEIKGAHRWLEVAGLRLQPSELAKLALIIALAHFGERYQRQMPTFRRGLLLPGLIILPVLALIVAEPDLGTTLLLAAVSGIVLYLAGTRLRYMVAPVMIAGTGLTLFLLNNPMRLRRLQAYFDLEANKEGVGYQTYQAMVALGSGGVTGLGLGDGRQKLGFVPEHHTDFIFSVIGEELGLIATLAVVVAFLVIVICGVYIAWNARDTFGMLLASGITSLIGLQAVINIGVVTGSLPNKGLSLPFMSYGGSNLVLMLACVGLLLNVARHAADLEDALLPMPADHEPTPQPS